jgi:hypothetical protein
MRSAGPASVCPVVLISRWLYWRPMAPQSLGIREPLWTHPVCCLIDALTGAVATLGVDGVLAQASKHRLKPTLISNLSNISTTSHRC